MLSGLTDLIDYRYQTANTLPKVTLDAKYYSFSPLPNTPTYSLDILTAGSAGTLYLNSQYIRSTSDYIFVAGQSATLQNGVYYQTRVGTASTTWQLTRVLEMNTDSGIYNNSMVRIPWDSTYDYTKWYLTTSNPITVGTTGLTFSSTASTSNPIYVATTGTNISISNLATSTVDGVSLSSLPVGTKVLVKDQIDNTENGVYVKSVSGFAITSTDYNIPFRVYNGSVNANTNWYKDKVSFNGKLLDRFISTTFFKSMTVGEVSGFATTTRPKLLEFKMNWNVYDGHFPMDELKVRFFKNIGSLPDYNNPLTSWKSVSYKQIGRAHV